MDEKLKIVKPYGHLYSNNQDYLLIQPFPIPGDNWEGDNCYRFLVVPNETIAVEQKGSEIYLVYSYPRHVVTNSFTIEYAEHVDIHIIASEEIKIETTMEAIEDDKEKFSYNF